MYLKMKSFISFLSVFSIFLSSSLAATLYPWHPERIAILSTTNLDYYKKHNGFISIGLESTAKYADRHGYTHIIKHTRPFSINASEPFSNWNRVFWTRQKFGSRTKYNAIASAEDNVAFCYDYDWVFWLDQNTIITNHSIKLEAIIEEAKQYTPDKGYPYMITTKKEGIQKVDLLNSNVALIRCSNIMLRYLNTLVDYHHHIKSNTILSLWNIEGASVLAYHKLDWVSKAITVVPQRVLDAYPYGVYDNATEPNTEDLFTVCDQSRSNPFIPMADYKKGAVQILKGWLKSATGMRKNLLEETRPLNDTPNLNINNSTSTTAVTSSTASTDVKTAKAADLPNFREVPVACQAGIWQPGDFLIHFPGSSKRFLGGFLKSYPPHFWDA
mmetsp:Transcript_28348/g.52203  ORF Transcript_28348/g.52203 Transcript_28348/m.52203 type:complete len:385 (-) Transcript_28348:889-2043(-)